MSPTKIRLFRLVLIVLCIWVLISAMLVAITAWPRPASICEFLFFTLVAMSVIGFLGGLAMAFMGAFVQMWDTRGIICRIGCALAITSMTMIAAYGLVEKHRGNLVSISQSHPRHDIADIGCLAGFIVIFVAIYLRRSSEKRYRVARNIGLVLLISSAGLSHINGYVHNHWGKTTGKEIAGVPTSMVAGQPSPASTQP